MTKDALPMVVMSAEVQAEADADPELATALREFSANARQAMQGVKDGTYTSFEEGIEKITGHKPERVDADDEDYEVAQAALKGMTKQ